MFLETAKRTVKGLKTKQTGISPQERGDKRNLSLQVGKTDRWVAADLADPAKLRPETAAGKDKTRPDGASENQG